MRIQMVVNFAALLLLFKQFALGKDLDMFGNGLSGRVKMLSYSPWCHCLESHQGDNGPACWISYGLKYISSQFHTFNMQLSDCKYICSHLTAQAFLNFFF